MTNDINEESDGDYEEYDGDYEEYGHVHQRCKVKAVPREADKQKENANNQILIKRKWCLLILCLSISIGALAIGLLIYFLSPTETPMYATLNSTTILPSSYADNVTTAATKTASTAAVATTATIEQFNAVLVLSSRKSSNQPFIVNFHGKNIHFLLTAQSILKEWSKMRLVFIMEMTLVLIMAVVLLSTVNFGILAENNVLNIYDKLVLKQISLLNSNFHLYP